MSRLLARGADPLFEVRRETALYHLQVIEVILGVFDERRVELSEVEESLKRSEEHEFENHQPDIVRDLRQFYWRRRYSVCA